MLRDWITMISSVVTWLGNSLLLHFTAIVRRPAWVEDDDEDCDPVPTFQSAFTEALGAADWRRYEADAGAQGNTSVHCYYYSNKARLMNWQN